MCLNPRDLDVFFCSIVVYYAETNFDREFAFLSIFPLKLENWSDLIHSMIQWVPMQVCKTFTVAFPLIDFVIFSDGSFEIQASVFLHYGLQVNIFWLWFLPLNSRNSIRVPIPAALEVVDVLMQFFEFDFLNLI